MSILQTLLGLVCAASVLLLLWQVALRASKYMIQHADSPPGLRQLTDSISGVKVILQGHDGHDLSCWHRGSGQPVVIIPESGFQASAYTPLWELLCGYGFRVVLFQPSPSSMNEPHIASENLEKVLSGLSIKSPLLLGHGFGAYTAFIHQANKQSLAHTRASGVISVSGFAGKPTSDSNRKIGQIFHKLSRYQTYLSAFGQDASATGVVALQAHTNQYPWEYLAQAWPPISSYYSAGQSDFSVSIIASLIDEILPFSHSREMKMAFPDALMNTVTSGEGHMLIWEAPGLIADEVRNMEKAARRMQKAG